MGEVKPSKSVRVIEGDEQGFATTRFQDLLHWAQKYSLFQYPFVTACCAMEFMSTAGPRFDLARFGAEAPRWTPRQADLIWIVGTVSHRQAPILKRVYDQMTIPKWVIAFGTCASCGGFYDLEQCREEANESAEDMEHEDCDDCGHSELSDGYGGHECPNCGCKMEVAS